MRKQIQIILFLLFVWLTQPRFLQTQKKGMTWTIVSWPNPENSWAGAMGCHGCNPYSGDTDCSESRPILCMVDYRQNLRPFYVFPKRTSHAYSDGGFYNGWTGGYFASTGPVVGTALKNKTVADNICKQYYGPTAQIMNHHLPRWMSNMNNEPSVWSKWNWGQTSTGGWNGWGYFKGSFSCTRMWTWILDQNANCGPN